MFRHRGHWAEPVDGEAALLPLLGQEIFRVLLGEDDLLGRVYQALNAPALESAYRASARDRRKFSDAEIPAVSQLFTPPWVVEFLLHNTLGRLWTDMHRQTRLRERFAWLVEDGSPRDGAAPEETSRTGEQTKSAIAGATLLRAPGRGGYPRARPRLRNHELRTRRLRNALRDVSRRA